jgi:mannose-6-phosphate isomerase-like protein (cupin superfamily)
MGPIAGILLTGELVPVITAAENESKLLGFRREQLADGIQVAHVAARSGENSLLHHHTRTRDTFYVLTGRLTVTLHLAEGDIPSDCYHVLSTTSPVLSSAAADGRHTHRVQLTAGEVLVIEPGVVHCASNLHDAVCRFLCIEGVGEYDFIQENLG